MLILWHSYITVVTISRDRDIGDVMADHRQPAQQVPGYGARSVAIDTAAVAAPSTSSAPNKTPQPKPHSSPPSFRKSSTAPAASRSPAATTPDVNG